MVLYKGKKDSARNIVNFTSLFYNLIFKFKLSFSFFSNFKKSEVNLINAHVLLFKFCDTNITSVARECLVKLEILEYPRYFCQTIVSLDLRALNRDFHRPSGRKDRHESETNHEFEREVNRIAFISFLRSIRSTTLI